jgi:hypothetical protein
MLIWIGRQLAIVTSNMMNAIVLIGAVIYFVG